MNSHQGTLDRATAWRSKDVFAYFNNNAQGYAVQNAADLRRHSRPKHFRLGHVARHQLLESKPAFCISALLDFHELAKRFLAPRALQRVEHNAWMNVEGQTVRQLFTTDALVYTEIFFLKNSLNP